ncbi:hypothetical protein A7985_04250 [Pseudoalteromonas luteoviolacea]|uniref:Uncharacterized protein n=1 Tax=Pseudoalteromonas luteoviolacea TaxID=43657 RepID=A0A1C0TV16_9GAMM|nr:hypothetical protein [Pseudoalteromonas luteoviolacea]OCQ23167.1 hypothetical protein A7985_04250 [Pseudoalteromonas luteoviolacea]
MIMRILGSLIFLPFIFFYSYVLGPVLKVVLLPGGLALLFLILGPKSFKAHWKAAYKGTTQPKLTALKS